MRLKLNPIEWYKRGLIRKARRNGLDMADDCRIIGLPNFGTEPWLIKIGKHVTLTSGVRFITHDGGTWVFRDQPRYKDVFKFGKIVVGDNVFIGNDALLMPGVTIGNNAVIGAGSVVTHDVPSGSVAAGVPARVLCTVEEYAEKCLARQPEYDVEAYRRDKRAETSRIYLK